MSGNLSSEQVEQQLVQAMGPDLGHVFHALSHEVAWLHAKWLEYRKLFAKSEERLDLLNSSAGFFFYTIQKVVWEDVLLHIARLLDPPKQGKHANLSLRMLPDFLRDQEAEPAPTLCWLLEVAEESAGFVRDWRDKHLAHRDLDYAMGRAASPLAAVSRQQVEQALASLRAVLNHLHTHYLGGQVGYEHFWTHSDADELVYHLSVARRAERAQHERLVAGQPLPEDLEAPPAI